MSIPRIPHYCYGIISVACLLLLVSNHKQKPRPIIILKGESVTEVKRKPIYTEPLPLCVDGSLMKTENLTLWTMLEGDGASGEMTALSKMIRRANLNLRDPFTPWVLEHKDNLISPTARYALLESGWNICTLVDGFNDSKLALRALWGMRGINRIIYLDPKTYISGDINALTSIPLGGVQLAATSKYNEEAWTTNFTTSVMVIRPNYLTYRKLNRGSAQAEGSSFEVFINELCLTRWYDLSYHYGTNTEIFKYEPELYEHKRAQMRIITFESAPWDVCQNGNESEIELGCDWWVSETDSDGEVSRYSNLFQKPVQDDSPVAQLPFPGTVVPIVYEKGLETGRQKTEATQDSAGYIYTPDRRPKRKNPLIPLVREDLFPNDADYDKHWVVAFGIPAVDTKKGAYFRKLQRDSFLRYSRVWNYHKSSDATVLAKYLLAYHPSTNYTYSPELLEEAKITKDILFFDLNEGVWSGHGSKQDDVLIGMSRKAYAFYAFVADRIRADYICKGDDDAFYRLNMLANDLQSYTFPMIYHGRQIPWYGIARTSGLLVTMSFDMADWVRDSMLVEDNIDFRFEDVMVGLWFFLGNLRFNFLKDCRGHCINRGYGWEILQNITDTSMVLHGILPTPEAFSDMMKRFPDRHLPRHKLKTKPRGNLDKFGIAFDEIGECPDRPDPINYYNWGGYCFANNTCSLPRRPVDPLLMR